MHPRVLLALVLTAVLTLGGAAVYGVLAGPGGGGGGVSTAEAFEGALRPEIPPQDFRLRDEAGRPVSLRALRGEVVALTFLYTQCEDTCPLTAATLGAAMSKAGGRVAGIAVSVDPEGDTPRNATRFLVERGLRGRLHFALGTRAQLAPVWKAYGIQPQGDAFDHSAYVVLLDKQGRQRVGHPFSALTVEGLAHDIRLLQREP